MQFTVLIAMVLGVFGALLWLTSAMARKRVSKKPAPQLELVEESVMKRKKIKLPPKPGGAYVPYACERVAEASERIDWLVARNQQLEAENEALRKQLPKGEVVVTIGNKQFSANGIGLMPGFPKPFVGFHMFGAVTGNGRLPNWSFKPDEDDDCTPIEVHA